MALKSRIAQAGLADFMDLDVPAGKIMTQLQLLRRLLNQAGLSDFLDVNLNKDKIAAQLSAISDLSATIPVNFDISQLPKLPAGSDTIQVNADVAGAVAQIQALKDRIASLSSTLARIPIDVNDIAAEAKVAKLQAQLLKLTETVASISIGADTSKIDAAIASEQAKLATLTLQASDLKMNADTTGAAAKIAALEAEAYHLEQGLEKMTADVDITRALTRIYAIEAELKVLTSSAESVRIAANITAVTAAIDAVKAKITALTAQANDIRFQVDTQGIAAAQAQLLGLEAAAKGVKSSADVAAPALTAMWTAGGGGGGWGVATGRITLFGGLLNGILPQALTAVSGIHLIGDAIVEIAAVVIPASLALVAFGIAGSDAAIAIKNQMTNVHTVMDVTGQAIYPMTNAMENLHKAVQPQVFQIFGDAIAIMNSKAGEFSKIAVGTANAVQTLAARFTYAITSGGGFSVFMTKAVQDVARLGTLVGNLGGIFGNLFKAVPGYANVLLDFAVGFTHVIEVITGSSIVTSILGIGLALHGFILYSGLAVTASILLAGGIARLGQAFITFGTTQMAASIGALAKFGKALLAPVAYLVSLGAAFTAVAASDAFEGVMATLAAVNPLVWVAAAAVVLGGLVYLMLKAKDATQQWTASLIKQTTTVPISQALTATLTAQTSVANDLATAHQKLSTIQETETTQSSKFGAQTQVVSAAYQQQQGVVNDLSIAKDKLNAQYQLESGRVGALAATYGSNTAALGAMNAAGITTAQLTDTNAQHWATALIQIKATTDAYKAMGVQGGVLGNDLQVLGQTETSQYQAIQKLNTAWTTFTGNMTATQSSFDTYALGLGTLSSNTSTFTDRLGSLRVAGTQTKAAIDNLSAAGLNLNQAYTQQITNTNAMLVSLRTAGVAQNLQNNAVKDSIIPLEIYAKGSQEATAQLVGLAEQAGYKGPVSLQALNKYLGITAGDLKNTSGATADLKTIADQATVQEGLLTGAMQSQGQMITSQLLSAINQAILKYDGVTTAVTNYGTALAQSGKNSTQAQQAMQTAIDAIVKAEVSMGDNTNQMAAVVAATFGISIPAAMKLVKQAMLDNQSTSQRTTTSITGDFANQSKAASNAKTDLDNYSTAIKNNGVNSDAAKAARQQLVKDLTDAGVNASTANADVGTYTAAVKQNGVNSDAAKVARQQLVKDILDASNNAVTGQRDLQTYNTYIANNQQTTDAGKAARAKLIADLVASGVNAQTATGLVDGLSTAVHNLPAGKTVNLYAVAHGSGNIVYKETFPGGSLQGALLYGQSGMKVPGSSEPGTSLPWKIPGWGGGDKFPAMLEAGETVVPKQLTPMVAKLMKAHNVPGFLGGGLVGNYGLPSDQMDQVGLSYVYKVQSAVDTAMAALLKNKLAAAVTAAGSGGGPGVAGPGGGNALLNAMLARSMMPSWANGAMWQAWDAVEMAEAGWNQFARNPSSGAYGIPQALPPSKMGAAANPPQSNPHAQISWMIGYIQSVYGNPINAWAHEQANHWYGGGGLVADQGTVLSPGWNMRYNGTSRPEALVPAGGSTGRKATLDDVVQALQVATTVIAQQGRQFASVLNSSAGAAASRGSYSNRR